MSRKKEPLELELINMFSEYVHHKNKWPFEGVLIDRTTRFGNKYWLYCKSKEPTHDEKVDAYAIQIGHMLESGEVSQEEVAALHHHHLICWCRDDSLPEEKQKRCHGDVLMQVADALYQKLWELGEVRSDGRIRVREFKGYYRFLSNFHVLKNKINWLGYLVPTVEHAYQMTKFIQHPEVVKEIALCSTPGETKKLARKYKDKIRSDWQSVSLQVMECLLRIKFSDLDLMQRLQWTKCLYLEEGNYWNDQFYGICLKTGHGSNHLGLLLMKVRDGDEYEDGPF